MSFKMVGPNRVESDEGYGFEVLSMTLMRYFEGDQSMTIECEVLSKPWTITLHADDIRSWSAPDQKQPFTAADRQRILLRLHGMFGFQGATLEVT